MKQMFENRGFKDEELVVKIQDGDKSALINLVKKWHKMFCEKAFWLVKDKSAAKDIAQDSWTTIMTKIENLKNPKQFKYWAFRIVYNKSLDYLRMQSKMNKTSLEQTSELKASNENYTENELLKSNLRKAISNLPIQQNQVVKLFYIEDYNLKQISEFLNISIGTAKSRLFHAREKLKITLKDKYYEN